jgi:hypothetical protein
LSVAAYVREANLGIQKEIQKKLDYAKAHPYPTDEMNEASKNKKKYKGYQLAIADLFGIYSPTGQIGDDPNTLDPEKLNAIKEGAEKISPGLWTRLQEGQLGLNKKIEVEEYLKNIDPNAEITEAFDKFYSAILKKQKEDPKITFDQVFAAGADDIFVDMLGLKYGIYFNLNSFGADGFVKAAFKELYDKKKSPTKESTIEKPKTPASSAINEKSNEASLQEKQSNQSTSTINEKPKTEAAEIKSTAQVKSGGAINEKTSSTKEPTSITSSEGSLTSKKVEVAEEKPKVEEKESTAININIENKKPNVSAESNKEKEGSFFNISSGSTINNIESNTNTTSNNPSTSELIKLGDNKTDNTTNNETNYSRYEGNEGKKKGGFLSKLGKFAGQAGDFLNLPSTGELGKQAKELFGVTTSNFDSRVSEIKESFAKNTVNSEDRYSPNPEQRRNKDGTFINTSSKSSESNVNNKTSSNVEKSESFFNVGTENKSMINVEQNKPTIVKEKIASNNEPGASTSSSMSSSTNTTNTASNTVIAKPSSTNQPLSNITESQASSSSNQPVVVDLNQLSQSINRLERILMSGIEVTIKET